MLTLGGGHVDSCDFFRSIILEGVDKFVDIHVGRGGGWEVTCSRGDRNFVAPHFDKSPPPLGINNEHLLI